MPEWKGVVHGLLDSFNEIGVSRSVALGAIAPPAIRTRLSQFGALLHEWELAAGAP